MSNDLTSNQIRGYKATLSNPNTSQEAKTKAQNILDEANVAHKQEKPLAKSAQNKSRKNNTDFDESLLDDGAEAVYTPGDEDFDGELTVASGSDTLDHQQIGGHVAAMHNPNVPKETKKRSAQILEDHGVDPDAYDPRDN